MSNHITKHISAAMLVDPAGRILLATRPAGKDMAGLWEFPGGKVQAGETAAACAARELKEELGIQVKESDLAPFTSVSHDYTDFQLYMTLFTCHQWDGIPTPQEGQTLAWIQPQEIEQYPMPAANCQIRYLIRTTYHDIIKDKCVDTDL